MEDFIDRMMLSPDRKTDILMQNVLQELLEHFEDVSYQELHDKLAEEYANIDRELSKFSAFEEISYMEMIVGNNLELMKEIEDVIDDYCISHGLLAVVMSHFWYIKRHGYNQWLDLAYRSGLVTEWDGSNLKDELTEQEKRELSTWL